MFNKYFDGEEVKDEYKKQFISLWTEWLGKDNYHQLDEVTEVDWAKFNSFVKNIFRQYKIQLVDLKNRRLIDVNDIEETLSDYHDSMNKTSEDFSMYIIPELDCILTEDWDFTYILWYKNNHAIKSLSRLIEESGLFRFS